MYSIVHQIKNTKILNILIIDIKIIIKYNFIKNNIKLEIVICIYDL